MRKLHLLINFFVKIGSSIVEHKLTLVGYSNKAYAK